jgi:hypothetical protein
MDALVAKHMLAVVRDIVKRGSHLNLTIGMTQVDFERTAGSPFGMTRGILLQPWVAAKLAV